MISKKATEPFIETPYMVASVAIWYVYYWGDVAEQGGITFTGE